MTNNKYIKWVKEAWSVLENDFLNQKFLPQGEFDIQAHMYFCLLKHRPKNIKKKIVY